MIVATTRAALLRGSSTDDLGDEVDTATPVEGFEDFAVSIVEKDATEFDQASNAWRTVQRLIGRAAANVPVDEGIGSRISETAGSTPSTMFGARRADIRPLVRYDETQAHEPVNGSAYQTLARRGVEQ